MNNAYVVNNEHKRVQTQGQYPKELRGMSPSQQERIMEEVQKIRDIEWREEQQFFDKIDRVFETFSRKGFSDDVAIQLTIAFLNDPVFQKKRAKRKTISEIIEQFKE